jgi:hypothetical protein
MYLTFVLKELIAKLGVDIPTIRRDPHYFLPTTGQKYLLFGSDRAEMKRQFIEHFSGRQFANSFHCVSEEDWNANVKLEEELEALRQDVGTTWLLV